MDVITYCVSLSFGDKVKIVKSNEKTKSLKNYDITYKIISQWNYDASEVHKDWTLQSENSYNISFLSRFKLLFLSCNIRLFSVLILVNIQIYTLKMRLWAWNKVA